MPEPKPEQLPFGKIRAPFRFPHFFIAGTNDSGGGEEPYTRDIILKKKKKKMVRTERMWWLLDLFPWKMYISNAKLLRL